MTPFIRIAARNLIKHRTRTLFIGGAITSVTAMLVLLMALTAGIRKTILDNATALASGHVNIAGFYKMSQSSASPVVTEFKPLLEMAQKEIPEAEFFYDRIKAYGKIISDTTSMMVPMWGVNLANEQNVIGRLPLAKKSAYIEGHVVKEGEPQTEGNLQDLAKPGNLVIFAAQAKKLKVKVGDSVTLSLPTYRNVYNTKDVRIAAILADMGMMSAFATFMHHEDAREIYQLAKTSTGQIMIFLKDVSKVPVVEERLRKLIAGRGITLMEKESQPYWMKFDRVSGESWTGQRIDVTTWQDETAYVKWVLDLLGTLTVVFTGVLLVIVILGLMNTLWMAIRERTTEIGTLRAIGLQRKQVLVMFLLEAVILSICSIIAGVIFGSLFAALLNLAKIPVTSEAFQMFLMSNRLTLFVQSKDVLAAMVLIAFFLVVSALLPSYRASKMKPIDALNHVS